MKPAYKELEKRSIDSKRVCEYGIPFLDDATNGIRPTDLIVVAGKTGVGKTQLATLIAFHNAKKGKKVFLFALEAEQYEIVRRIKYQIVAKLFFERKEKYPGVYINYCDFTYGKLPELRDLELEACELFEMQTENIRIHTPTSAEFGKEELSTLYEAWSDAADLIILDHIHYLTQGERESEYDHIKKTMCTLRNAVNRKEVPIIAFSHLRKENKRDAGLVPALEELHGSSEISKQANLVVGFSPVYELPKKDNPKEVFETPAGATLCKIIKARAAHDGCDRYAAYMPFDMETRTYKETYVPYRINKHLDNLTTVPIQDFERWMVGQAREAKN